MKALISILLLLGAAVTIFVAGWIQILLPAATYAVLFSKTGGFDSRVVAPGTFVWRWERLIPTNVTLFRFEVQPYSINSRISGELPSADAIASVLPGHTDFHYQVSVRVTFAVRPEALPELVAAEGLTRDTLADWTRTQADAIGRAAVELVQRRGQTTALPDLTALETELLAPLAERFPDLDIRAVRFAELRLPDLEIYERARGAYLALLEAQQEARRAAVAELAYDRERDLADQEAQRAALQVLREYGVVLQEYPVLIQFLALQNGADRNTFLALPVAPEAGVTD